MTKLKTVLKKIKHKLVKSRLTQSSVALLLLALFFILSPSCGQRGSEVAVVFEKHKYREGHVTAASTVRTVYYETKTPISDVSVNLNDEESENKTLEVSFNIEKEGEIKEVTLTGAVNESGVVELFDGGQEDEVVGYGNCYSPDCEHVVVSLYYLNSDDNLRSFQTEAYTSAENNPIVHIEEEDPDPEAGRGAEYIIQADVQEVARRLNIPEEQREEKIEEFVEHQPTEASSGFVTYWQNYLNALREERDVNISSDIPRDSVDVERRGSVLIYSLNRSVAMNTFARPLNMRSSLNLQSDGASTSSINGLLLNAEALANDPENCVKWVNTSDSHILVRHASALLNAVLLYVGGKFKRSEEEGCSIDIVVNKSANEEGGILYFISDPTDSHKTHQNGLDVDIAYIKAGAGLSFPDVVDGSRVTLTREDSENNLKLLKEFYDTGVVNSFIISPHVKANLVKVAREMGELDKYRDALEKAFPYDHHENHIHLEIVCGTFRIGQNVGCRDTNKKDYKWPISYCDDTICDGSSNTWTRIVVEETANQGQQAEQQAEIADPETQREGQQAEGTEQPQDTDEESGGEIAQTETTNPEPQREEQQAEGTEQPQGQQTETADSPPHQPDSPAPESVERTVVDIDEIPRCNRHQRRAIRDEGHEDPEICMPVEEGEAQIASFVENTTQGLELCRFRRRLLWLEPNVCRVRTPLVSTGELRGELFPECTRRQIRAMGDPIASDLCTYFSQPNVANFVEQNKDNGLCMLSMHICKTE